MELEQLKSTFIARCCEYVLGPGLDSLVATIRGAVMQHCES